MKLPQKLSPIGVPERVRRFRQICNRCCRLCTEPDGSREQTGTRRSYRPLLRYLPCGYRETEGTWVCEKRSLTEVRLCFALRDLCSTSSAERELTSGWESCGFRDRARSRWIVRIFSTATAVGKLYKPLRQFNKPVMLPVAIFPAYSSFRL